MDLNDSEQQTIDSGHENTWALLCTPLLRGFIIFSLLTKDIQVVADPERDKENNPRRTAVFLLLCNEFRFCIRIWKTKLIRLAHIY